MMKPVFDFPEYSGKLTDHRAYRVWCKMVERCHNPNAGNFSFYGGRGIVVCDDWRNSSRAFLSWCDANGYDSVLQLDRIDNSAGYSPENCRFVTPSENCLNRRNTVRLRSGKPALPVARRNGISQTCFDNRVWIYGWSPDDAATVPAGRKRLHDLPLFGGLPRQDAPDGFRSVGDAALAAVASARLKAVR